MMRSYVPDSWLVASTVATSGWCPAAASQPRAAPVRHGSTSTLLTRRSPNRWHSSAAEYPDPVPTSSTSMPPAGRPCRNICTVSDGSVEDEVGRHAGRSSDVEHAETGGEHRVAVGRAQPQIRVARAVREQGAVVLGPPPAGHEQVTRGGAHGVAPARLGVHHLLGQCRSPLLPRRRHSARPGAATRDRGLLGNFGRHAVCPGWQAESSGGHPPRPVPSRRHATTARYR